MGELGIGLGAFSRKQKQQTRGNKLPGEIRQAQALPRVVARIRGRHLLKGPRRLGGRASEAYPCLSALFSFPESRWLIGAP